MLFSSITFLCYFLPVVLVASYFLAKYTNKYCTVLFIIFGSLFFYSWNYPPHIALITFSILGNYFVAKAIYKLHTKLLLLIGVTANLALLGWFKYAGLFSSTIGAFTDSTPSFGVIVLPLAISFFTFQQIAYLVDVYQSKTKPARLVDYIFFVSFFPQLIAGPIVHLKEVLPQLKEQRFLNFNGSDLVAGLVLFSFGLAKKVFIADELRHGSDRIFDATANGIEPTMLESWVGMLCYSFQIYFDFSGYSDMALGLARMFGLQLPKNFYSPYKSKSIIDFWRRWNITLSHFLRDYLYYPLGGNRRGRFIRYVNLFIVMLLGGLWHGASWTFVVWGGLHGLYLTVNHAWRGVSSWRIPTQISVPLTFIAVTIAWVFFRADTFGQAFVILSSMFGMGTQEALSVELLSDLTWLYYLLALAVTIVWFTPNIIEVIAKYDTGMVSDANTRCLLGFGALLLAASLFSIYSKGTYEFLYFQF